MGPGTSAATWHAEGTNTADAWSASVASGSVAAPIRRLMMGERVGGALPPPPTRIDSVPGLQRYCAGEVARRANLHQQAPQPAPPINQQVPQPPAAVQQQPAAPARQPCRTRQPQ